MCNTCVMVAKMSKMSKMSKMIQIRNVPDTVHREVKARAARSGMSLSEYLLREVEQIVAAPPVEEVVARLESRARPQVSESPAVVIRVERDTR